MTREAKAPCKKDYACENGDIINVYWGGKVVSKSFGSPVQINDPRFATGAGEVGENADDALVKDIKLTGKSDAIRVTFGTGSTASASQNRVAPFASYSITSVECIATKALTSNAPFQFKLVDANAEGVYIKTNSSLKRSVCEKYKVTVKVVDSVHANATAFLSVEINLLNTNDAPVFNANSVADRRIVMENAIVGAVVDQTEKIVGSGIYNTNTDPIATDADVGQDLTYTIVHANSKPAISGNENTFGVSSCSGQLFTKTVFTDPFVTYLCVTACDDPNFFGSTNPNDKLCANPLQNGISINTNSACGDAAFKSKCDNYQINNTNDDVGGVCISIGITNVNTPPVFNQTKYDAVTADRPQIYIDENQNAKTNFTRGKLTDYFVDVDESTTLTFSVSCYSCPTASITSITRATNAMVTTSGNHKFKTGDFVMFQNVVGMVEVNNYEFAKAITVTSPTTFSLNFDTSNLASAISGSGGTVTRADVSITPDGMLQSNRVFDFLADGSRISILVTASDGKDSVQKNLIVAIKDINNAPQFLSAGNTQVFLNEGTYGPFGINNKAACCAAWDSLGLSGQLSQGGIIEASDIDTDSNFMFNLNAGGSYSLNGTNAIKFCVCEVSGSTTRVTLQPNGTLDYEDSNNTKYAIAITAIDQYGLQGTGVVTVLVGDKNEAPVVSGGTNNAITITILENATVPGTLFSNSEYGINDPDGDTAFNFEFEPWTYSTSPLDKYLDNSKYFRIHPTTGEIILLKSLDYEIAPNTYVLGVKITDGGGLSSTMNVTFTIDGVQEKPVFGSNTYSLNEAVKNGSIPQFSNSLSGFQASATDPEGDWPLMWKLIGGNQINNYDVFVMNSSGWVSINSSLTENLYQYLSYEIQAGFNLRVSVSDAAGSGLETVGTIVINLGPVNDPPILTTSTKENDNSTWVIMKQDANAIGGTSDSPAVTATDEDIGSTFTYAIIAFYAPYTNLTATLLSDCPIAIHPISGILSMKSDNPFQPFSWIDEEVDTGVYVVVQLTDNVGQESNTEKVYIKVLGSGSDLSISATIFPSGVASIAENTAKGTTLGNVSNVLDNNNNAVSPLTYKIVAVSPSYFHSNDAAKQYILSKDAFFINASTGDLVLNVEGIDYERNGKLSGWSPQGSINVTVKISGNSMVETKIFQFTMKDGNEAPLWYAGQAGITVDENQDSSYEKNAKFVATDMDASNNNNAGAGIDVNDLTLGTLACTNCDYTLHDVKIWQSINQTYESFKSHPFQINGGGSSTTRIFGNSIFNISLTSNLDYETTDKYILQIRATDSNGLYSDGVLTITVGDINEPPSLQLTSAHIKENYYGSISQSGVSSSVAYNLVSATTDPEDAFSCVYDILGSYNQVFEIVSTTGKAVIVPIAASGLDFEDQAIYELTIRVNDTVGSPMESATSKMNVTVGNQNDLSVPHFNGIVYSNFPTTGGNSIILHGTDIGPTWKKFNTTGVDPQITVTYGPKDGDTSLYTAVNCVIFDRNTQLKCDTVPGVGTDLVWTVAIDGDVSPVSTDAISFAPPSIYNVLGASNIPTEGNSTFILNGTNFGPDGTIIDYVEYTNSLGDIYVATGCKVLVAFTQIQCKTSSGVGNIVSWTVAVGGQKSLPASTLSDNVGYSKPKVTSLTTVGSPENPLSSNDTLVIEGTSGEEIEIIGTDFGADVSKINAYFGPAAIHKDRYSAAPCTLTKGNNGKDTLKCNTPPGVAADHTLYVIVGGQEGLPFPRKISYEPPVIIGVEGPGASGSTTIGGESIFIIGKNFGPPTSLFAPSNPCTLNNQLAGLPHTTSDSKNDHVYANLKVEYGRASSNLDLAYFGQCCIISSSQLIQCYTSIGTGNQHAWKVNIGSQDSSILHANTSYGNPVVRDYEKVTVPVDQLRTDGNDYVNLVGENFGSSINTLSTVTYGSKTGVEFQVNVSLCTMVIPHTKIQCPTIQGAGTLLKWIIIVDELQNVAPTTSYDRPNILSINGMTNTSIDANNLNPAGGEWIEINGTNLGPIGSNYPIEVTYGPSGFYYKATDCSIVLSSTIIRCKTSAGVGVNHVWTIKLRGQQSTQCSAESCKSSYKLPVISRLVPNKMSTAGVARVVLYGNHYGLSNSLGSGSVYLNGEKLPGGILLPQSGSEERFEFTVPPGYGLQKSIVLRIVSAIGEKVSSNVLSFNYSDPVIDYVQVANATFNGGTYMRLVVRGRNFCGESNAPIYPSCGRLIVHPENSESITLRPETPNMFIESYDHTQIVAYITFPTGEVSVSVGEDAIISNKKLFSTISPIIRNIPSECGGCMTEIGLHVPPQQKNLDKHDFSTAPFNNDDKVKLHVSGLGDAPKQNEVCVTLGNCIPLPLCVDVNNAADQVVNGINYGPWKNGALCDPLNPSGGRIGIVKNLTLFTSVPENVHSIMFDMPSGVGVDNELLVWSSGQPSLNAPPGIRIKFKAPELLENPLYVTPYKTNPAGSDAVAVGVPGKGIRVKLSGENFGAFKENAKLTYGGVDLIASDTTIQWSHGEINVTLPEGQGGPYDLILTVGDQPARTGYLPLPYMPPKIDSIKPTTGPTAGGQNVKIVGDNLGCSDTDNSMKLCGGGHVISFSGEIYTVNGTALRSFPCNIYHVQQDYINCTTTSGRGQNLDVLLSSAQYKKDPLSSTFNNPSATSSKLNTALNAAYSYLAPLILDAYVRSGGGRSTLSGPTSGLDDVSGKPLLIVLSGLHFGKKDSDTYVTLRCNLRQESKNCVDGKKIVLDINSHLWSSNDTSIQFAMPPGIGQSLYIEVTAGGQLQTNPLPTLFSYDGPEVTSFDPMAGPTDACENGFFEDLNAWRARTDGKSAEQITNNPVLHRRCNKYTTVKIKGKNFGNDVSGVKITIGQCTDYKTPAICVIQLGSGVCEWNDNEVCVSDGSVAHDSKFILFDGSVEARPTDAICQNPASREQFCACYASVDHNEINICAPIGYGQGLTLKVNIRNRFADSNNAKFSFAAPEITTSLPRPLDARGFSKTQLPLEIRGNNFGKIPSETNVTINGIECEDSEWKAEHPLDGRPYISCLPAEDVVGPKHVTVGVAIQSTVAEARATPESSVVYTKCTGSELDENGKTLNYWGRIGELCAECPDGALCEVGSYEDPVSQVGFWREPLDITANRADSSESNSDRRRRNRQLLQAASDSEDRIDAKGKDDFNRAGTILKKGNVDVQRCSTRRLFSDVIKNQFPQAHQRDQCYDFVPCTPLKACTGNNTCLDGYQHQQPNCLKIEPELDPELMTCNVTMQCRTRSAGLPCKQAINDVCQCPEEWNWRSFSCLKNCLKNKVKSSRLETACKNLKGVAPTTIQILKDILTRKECGGDNPEDCSNCVAKKNETTGKTYGMCECVPGYRCQLCTFGTHYRDGKVCKECPELPGLIIVAFIFAIFIMIAFVHWLDKKNFNLAFINIGWDYFQVVAMFTDADVNWPPILYEFYIFLSFFSFDVDIVTPECLLPELGYEAKFYGIILSPLYVGLVVLIAFFIYSCYHQGFLQRKRDKTAWARFFSAYWMSIYFLYITVTRKALEIFNCNPTTPYDGYLYTEFVDYQCDSGLCRCGDPDHLQYRLVLPAVLALLIITLGFPLYVIYVVKKHHTLVKEDQILRAYEIGDTPNENPDAFHIRIQYHKMYYHFKPGKVYWIVIIIFRKTLIAFAALVFRSNPGFQLAFVLLVLFLSYILQVQNQPFMSTVQRNETIRIHKHKTYVEKNQVHISIQAKIDAAISFVKKRDKRESVRGRKVRYGADGHMISHHARGGKSREYFWDYNTVEQVLLACLIFICLSGIMFESDRFQSGGTTAFLWQRDLITWLVIFVLLFSMIYYTIVLISEIAGYVPKCFKTLVKQGYKAKRTSEHGDDVLDLVVNPLMAKNNLLQGTAGTTSNDDEIEELEKLTDDFDLKLDGKKKKIDGNDDDDGEIEFSKNPLMTAEKKHNDLPPELLPLPGDFLPPPPLPDDTEAEVVV
jgi:hypothetical protein